MTFGILTLIVACGLVGPLLASASRLTVPVVVGEIAAGVLVGQTGLREVHPNDPTLAFLSEMGFAMLMFIVGTRLPLRDRGLRRAIGTGTIATALSFAIAVPAAWLLADLSDIDQVPMFVVLLATSSAAVVLPIVGERDMIGGPLLPVLAWITLTDIASIVALPLALEPSGALRAAAGALVVTAAAALAFGALRILRTSRTGKALRKGSRSRGWALDLRVSLLVLFGLAALAVEVSTSILVAGFAAGIAVALAGEPKRLARQLVGLAEGFFVPLFFVTLGARLDVRALATSRSDLALAAMLIVAVALCHVLVASVLRMPRGAGLLASAQLGLPAGVVTLGLSSGAIDSAQAAAIVLAALCSLVLTSIGAARLARSSQSSIA